MTIEIRNKDKICFYEDFHSSGQYILEYKVLKGGNMDIDVTITSPNGKSLYNGHRRNRDTFKFETSKGTFMVCLSNQFSTITSKFVYFDLRSAVADSHGLAHEAEGKAAVPKVNTRGEESMEIIHRFGTQVMAYQKMYRQNEVRGRYAAEQLNKHLFWWPLAQSIAILVSGLGQLLVLKRFFSYRRDAKVHAPSLDGCHRETQVPAGLPVRP
jgi:protein ERP2